MKKKSFEKLDPVLLDREGEVYEIPPEEFARICPVCVKGSRKSVETAVELAKIKKESPEAFEGLTQFFKEYSENKETKNEAAPETEEERVEREKREAFFSNFDDPMVAWEIYTGKAKNEAEAKVFVEKDRQERAQKKIEKERKQKVDMFRYHLKPFTVEVNRPLTVLDVTNGRTSDWEEMTDNERKVALKKEQTITLSLKDYIEICPRNVREPNPEELKQWIYRFPMKVQE